ncbi:uncharacterized protein EV420DRAFT_513172 [Desarmillaria tabescens]|uniref:Uncharacterized protein n=1 Tax=Armillaria tabescens TaxID=1929756 RepID=A0AA39KAD8_ARMTA|nr:uncharacterized protein EV420DRAFT_513172 [Desarmillaria tabescens]KAK0457208.1 hypothetical protein EV420DRAFT_513172 [Desarmillaria tabescens]
MSSQTLHTAFEDYILRFRTHKPTLSPSNPGDIRSHFQGTNAASTIIDPMESFLRVIEATGRASALSEIPMIWGCIKHILTDIIHEPSLFTPVSSALEHMLRRLYFYDDYPSHTPQDMGFHIADVYGAVLGLLYKIQKSFGNRGKVAAFVKVTISRHSVGSELQKAVNEFDSAQDRLEIALRVQCDSSSETSDEWVRSEIQKIRKDGTWPRRGERRKTCLMSGFQVMPASGSMAY